MTQVLMKSNLDTPFISIRNFYINRIRRIIPALTIAIVVTVLALVPKLLYSEMLWVMRSAISSSLFFSNYYYQMVQGYFDPSAENNPFIHTWSLSVEWQFYIFYPWIIVGLRRYLSFVNVKWVIRIILISSFLYCLWQTEYLLNDVYYDSVVRTWEFVAGALVVFEQNWLRTKLKQFGFSTLIILLLFGASFYLIDKSKFPGWQGVFPVFFTMFVIVASSGFVYNVLSNKVLQFFGNISYSLYLWHWVVYVYVSTVIVEIYEINLGYDFLLMLASIVLAYFSYRYIETPTRNRDGLWTTSKLIYLWLTLVLFVVAVTYFVVSTKNSNVRLPEYINRVESSLRDTNPLQSQCFLQSDEVKSRGALPKFCKFGSDSSIKPRVFLWGDSFADALQPAVTESLVETDKVGVAATAAGCAPIKISGYTKQDKRDKEYEHCGLVFGKSAFEYIKSNANIETVIYAANWSRYSPELLGENLINEICDIKNLGKKIIFIGQIPFSEYDVPKHWAKVQLNSGGKVDELSFSIEQNRDVIGNMSKIISDVKGKCGDFIYYDPSSRLCKDNKCMSVRDGVGYYWDSSHLTNSGAMLLKDDIVNLLSR